MYYYYVNETIKFTRSQKICDITLKLYKLVLHDSKVSEVSFLKTTLELRMSLLSPGVVIGRYNKIRTWRVERPQMRM